MKVLVGVCGIGRGHSIRQYEIVKELLNRGHEVMILTFGEGFEFFCKCNLNVKVFEVFVPYITFKNSKIDYKDCFFKNYKNLIPGTLKNINVFRKIIMNNFIPDICISDYEPVVQKIANILNKKVINIDQHSKFCYMDDEVNGFSNIEEVKRLKMFFNENNKKISVSFYNVDVALDNKIQIVYPIIQEDIIRKRNEKNFKKNKNKVVVYFSKYIDTSIKQNMNSVIEILRQFKNFEFLIFTNEKIKSFENIKICKKDRKKFINELIEANAVISTAGHSLISEALYCNIPIFTVPLPTFDQNYCADFIKKNKIGYSSDIITYENLKEFLENIEQYKFNIENSDKLVKYSDSKKYIVDKIEESISK